MTLKLCEHDAVDVRATAAELAIRLCAREFSAKELAVAAETLGKMAAELDADALRNHLKAVVNDVQRIYDGMTRCLRQPTFSGDVKDDASEVPLIVPGKTFRALLAELGELAVEERRHLG